MKRANITTIPLKTIHCNVSKFKGEIRPYEGFIKQTGAYIGNVLAPFNKTTNEIENVDDVYVDQDNNIYTLKENKLYVNDQLAINMEDAWYWKEDTVVESGYVIVGFLDDETPLLSDYTGRISVDGISIPGIAYENKQVRSVCGDKENFAFSLGTKVHICSLSGDTYTVNTYNINSQDKLSIYRNNNDFYYSTGDGGFLLNGAYVDNINVIVKNIDGTVYQTYTLSGTNNSKICLSVTKNGNFLCLKPFEWKHS